jgi:hypothetical protein
MSRYKVEKYPWGHDDPEVTRYTHRRIKELQGRRIFSDTEETGPYIKRYFDRLKGLDTDAKNPL